jgi:hypothetical protein
MHRTMSTAVLVRVPNVVLSVVALERDDGERS